MSRPSFSLVFAVLALRPDAVLAAQNSASSQTQVSRQAIADFSRCVVHRHRRQAVESVLRKSPRVWQVTSSAERTLADRACLPPGMSRDESQALLKMQKDEKLRPAFAEALVRKEFRTFDPQVITTAQPLEYGKLVDSLWPPDACKDCKGEQLRQFQDARAKSTELLAPLVFGECVVRTDPANAHRLLMTESGSADESATFGVLGPALSNCVTEGSRMTATKRALREAVALNFYRLAHAPRVQPIAGASK